MPEEIRLPIATVMELNPPEAFSDAPPTSLSASVRSLVESSVPSISLCTFESCERVLFSSATALFMACCHLCTWLLFSA